jgi:hypothetical protein
MSASYTWQSNLLIFRLDGSLLEILPRHVFLKSVFASTDVR